MSDISWNTIFDKYNIHSHDFRQSPFIITVDEIKEATKELGKRTADREVRILVKHDTRESRPTIFKQNNLFILPIRNGRFAILQGEGYVDIPEIDTSDEIYTSELDFTLETVKVGNSEMQHLDYAYAVSLVRTFMDDQTLVLTIRGRKYTPQFLFKAGMHQHLIDVQSVQTEVDAGYEGKEQIQ